MKFNNLRIAGAVAFALFATPASASIDPVSDFFEGIFGQEARLQNHDIGWRGKRRGGRYYYNGYGGEGNVIASYYGGGERLNSHTANGERFNPYALTAAHRSLPFGTLLHVCAARCATVRINDRGPAAYTGRSLDLSRGAAQAIGMGGVARVSVTRVD